MRFGRSQLLAETGSSSVSRVFCIVGPTAVGKSELAADVAVRVNGEVVSADAFQVYRGFDILSAKPAKGTVQKVPHHLIGIVPVEEEMSAVRYREFADPVIADINARGKLPVLVGGSGLYVKALTEGLEETPPADPRLREELNELSTDELRQRLTKIDSLAARTVDLKNRRRVIRAIEIAAVTSRADVLWSGDVPMVESRPLRRSENRCSLHWSGVFVFRDRDQLYQRINQRGEAMLREGAIDEVKNAGKLGATVEQMIGIKDIRAYLAGTISEAESLTRIQQATRRYAKRQLTWFRHQTNFKQLNLSLLTHNEAVQWVSRRAFVGRAVND